jgi:hypothetical protein
MSLQHLENHFENLKGQYDENDFSPPDLRYNCVAWAAGEKHRPWWPIELGGYYWPSGIKKKENLKAFVTAFETLGYRKCGKDARLEAGIEKIAIYTDDGNVPTHAARQLGSGLWTSKCGEEFEDIRHKTLETLEGTEYGRVAVIMRRRHDGKLFLTDRILSVGKRMVGF